MVEKTIRKNYIILVVGGQGYVGKLLVRRLLDKGYCNIRVFDCCTPKKDSFLLNDSRIEFIQGDLIDEIAMNKACKNVRRVIHLATPSYLVTNKKLLYHVNVDGTKNIISACLKQNVNELIYCSSASVVFSSKNILLGDESLPYVQEGQVDAYNVTKAEGEKLILKAHNTSLITNEAQGGKKKMLKTIALRPHSIFGCNGEGQCGIVDPMLIAIKKKKLKFIIGDGNNLSDFTHVENVVHAVILAGEVLSGEKTINNTNNDVGGKAYNITNEEPIKFWKFISDLSHDCGFKRPSIHIPYALMIFVAFILQLLCGTNITFNIQRVRLLALHHTYSTARAKLMLGYSPIVTFNEGFKDTIAFIRQNDHEIKQKKIQ